MGISAQELRIGNYILDETGVITIIVAIDSERKFWNEIIQKEFKATARLIMLDNFDWNTSYGCWVEKLKPIPLTEEWLLKFGFSDKEYKKGYIGKDFKSGGMILDFVLSKPFLKGEWNNTYTFDFEGHRFSKMEFVHELQNFYYCLTGVMLSLS